MQLCNPSYASPRSSQLSVGIIAAATDASVHVPMEDRFRGQNILSVVESTEPSALRWSEIGTTTMKKYQERTCTWFATFAVIIGAAFTVYAINRGQHEIWTAVFISIFNTLIPIICYIINSFESHASEGGAQESLYMKVRGDERASEASRRRRVLAISAD